MHGNAWQYNTNLLSSQLGRVMCTNASTEDEQLSKAALFSRYVEALPRAVSKAHDVQQLVALLGALLGEVRSVVQWDRVTHQTLFRCVVGFVGLTVCVVIVSCKAPKGTCYGQRDGQRDGQHRDAGCFVQVINLLNRDYPAPVAITLCCEVIHTLRALLVSSPDAHDAFKALVGYDTLQKVLLERCSVPPRAVLQAVVAMLLQVC